MALGFRRRINPVHRRRLLHPRPLPSRRGCATCPSTTLPSKTSPRKVPGPLPIGARPRIGAANLLTMECSAQALGTAPRAAGLARMARRSPKCSTFSKATECWEIQTERSTSSDRESKCLGCDLYMVLWLLFSHLFVSMVTIPKGHTGRWDVNSPIHKVWAVNAHDRIEESGPVIRAQVDYYKDYFGSNLMDTSANDPLYGNTGAVASASNTFYDVGPTKVGTWTSQPGSFEVAYGERQWFFMLEGTLFITNASDGTSKRCVAGDTVMLPAGWSGYVDVVEPAKKVFTVAK